MKGNGLKEKKRKQGREKGWKGEAIEGEKEGGGGGDKTQEEDWNFENVPRRRTSWGRR